MDAANFDLNTATALELCAEYPRLGLLTAEDIVAWRDEHGPFTDGAALVALVEGDEELAAALAARIAAAPPDTPPAAEPVPDVNPCAPPTGADEGPREPDDVFTSAPSSTSDTGPADDFRARLAAARALAEAVAANRATNRDAHEPEPNEPHAEHASVAETPPATDAGIAGTAAIVDATSVVHAAAVVDAAPVVDAVSQTMPIVPSTPPRPPSEAPRSMHAERPARRVSVHTIALVAIVLANAGLGFGLASLHHDTELSRKPVAAMSAEVKVLQSAQATTTTEIERTRARLDEHEGTLAKTIEKVNVVAQRQADAERAAKEHADQEAKEVDAMKSRVNQMERKVDRERYSIDDVLKAIDVAQGNAPAEAPSHRSASDASK